MCWEKLSIQCDLCFILTSFPMYLQYMHLCWLFSFRSRSILHLFPALCSGRLNSMVCITLLFDQSESLVRAQRTGERGEGLYCTHSLLAWQQQWQWLYSFVAIAFARWPFFHGSSFQWATITWFIPSCCCQPLVASLFSCWFPYPCPRLCKQSLHLKSLQLSHSE